jgi:hypothetical protein
MAADLPPPNVKATHPPVIDGEPPYVDVVIDRDGKARSYRGTGSTETERTAHVVTEILRDHRNAEFIPRG